MDPITNLAQNGKQYTAIVSYRDTCCENPHVVVQRIRAFSSRDALAAAKRRCRRNGITKTGEIAILRGYVEVTGLHTPKEAAHYLEDENLWTAEETQNRRYV